MKKCLILANGEPPKKSLITFLDKKGYSTLICADGGANSAFKLELIPDIIIGDLDSILPEIYDYYFDKCKIVKLKRQNDTDVEKCLKYAIKCKFNETILTGVTGDRLDHTFCNLGIALKFINQIKIRIIHHNSILEVLSGKVIIDSIPGEIISIYGFDEKTKITSKGLKYPLRNISLPFGKRDGTSNVAISKKVELNIKNGNIFLIRNFELIKSHGLF